MKFEIMNINFYYVIIEVYKYVLSGNYLKNYFVIID